MKASVAIRVGSPKTKYEFVKRAFESVIKNIGTDSYQIVTSFADHVDDEIKSYVLNLIDSERIIHLDEDYPSHHGWPEFVNDAIDESQDAEYFVELHDDVELLSDDLVPTVDSHLDDISNPVGWITGTDKVYLDGQYRAIPARGGFHSDYLDDSVDNIYQFHNLPGDWMFPPTPIFHLLRVWNKLAELFGFDQIPPTRSREYYENLPYDIPEKPVKIHSPYSDLMIIKMDVLEQIGKCETWGTPILTDEDWGLRALQENLYNIWIPDIEYWHHRIRSQSQMISESRKEFAHEQFRQKWGFSAPPESGDIEYVQEQYPETNIPWSIGRKTYEWDYVC